MKEVCVDLVRKLSSQILVTPHMKCEEFEEIFTNNLSMRDKLQENSQV